MNGLKFCRPKERGELTNGHGFRNNICSDVVHRSGNYITISPSSFLNYVMRLVQTLVLTPNLPLASHPLCLTVLPNCLLQATSYFLLRPSKLITSCIPTVN